MTTRVDQLAAATSIASTDLIVVEQGNVLKQGTPALLPFAPSGTGAVERPSQTKLREIGLCPEDFGAVGTGTADDLTALTNWLNAVKASDSRVGYMQAKTYGISGSLPDINASGVRIYGAGAFGNHNSPSNATISGSVIKALTGCTGTMLTIAPTEGASSAYLFGIELVGVTLNAANIAAKGLVTKSMRYCRFDICVMSATTTGWEMNVSTTLGDSTASQMNTIRYTGRQATVGVSLRLMGTASGNPSFNHFEWVDIVHKNDIAIIEENADNNLWSVVRLSQVGGGSAANSIEWRGGATAGVSCRNETFLNLSATVAAIAKGTGTYTVGAADIQVMSLDKGNSTPAITVESGATASYGYLSSSAEVFGYGSVDAFTISAAGVAVKGLADLSDSTSGQVKFPATQNASANANTLDDYEEGSWTPAFAYGTPGDLAVVYSTQVGSYTKIGRLVIAPFRLVTSSFVWTTSGGNFLITGLPFQGSGLSGMRWMSALSWSGVTKANYTSIVARIGVSTTVSFVASGSGVAVSTVSSTDVPSGGTVDFEGVLVYETT